MSPRHPSRRRAAALTPFSPSSFRAPRRARSRSSSTCAAPRRPPRAVGFDAVFGSAAHELLAWCLRTRPPAGQGRRRRHSMARRSRSPIRCARMVQMTLDEVRRRLPGRELLIEARVDLPWAAAVGLRRCRHGRVRRGP